MVSGTLRPHRHAAAEPSTASSGVLQGHRRRDQLEAERRAGRRQRRRRHRSRPPCSTKVETLSGVRAAAGLDRGRGQPRRQAPASGSASRRDGDRRRRRQRPTTRRSVPLKLVAGAWPRHGDRDRDRRGHRDQAALHSRPDGRRVRRRRRSQRYRISGIVTFGSADSLAGVDAHRLRPPTAQRCSASSGKFDPIRVGAKQGVSPRRSSSSRSRRAARPARRRSRPRDAQAAADTQGHAGWPERHQVLPARLRRHRAVRRRFVIANTLAITVAQRMREFATLRTLGASRRQVLALRRARVAGRRPLGSVIGLFLGLGIAVGLTRCSRRRASSCRTVARSSLRGRSSSASPSAR